MSKEAIILEGKLIGDLYDVLIKYEGQITTTSAVGALEMLKNNLIKHGFEQTIKVMTDEQR